MFAAIVLVAGALLAAVGGGAAWYVNGQKKLVHAEELCANALSQIGVQQASRWDALNALAGLVQGYSEQEYKTIMGAVAARKAITAASPASEVDSQQALQQTAVSRVSALAEAYPALKSDAVYLKAMDAVQHNENNIRVSRMVYNDTVTKYNRLVRSLPGTLVAGSLGFAPREYLQEDPGKAELPTFR